MSLIPEKLLYIQREWLEFILHLKVSLVEKSPALEVLFFLYYNKTSKPLFVRTHCENILI